MRVRGVVTAAILAVATCAAAAASGVVAPIEPGPARAVAEPARTASAVVLVPEPRTARKQRPAPPIAPPVVPIAPLPGGTEVSPLGAFPLGGTTPLVLGTLGIPEIVLNAYRAAELQLMAEQPGCGVSWNLLAGIGRIESGHARGGRIDSIGTTVSPILGPTLDGTLAGNAVIRDTDGGAIDGDPHHDRAVGAMQFIPSTWASWASDGNADGVADPNNVFDAALASARYLCSGGVDMRQRDQLHRAVLRYNNSSAYVADVLLWSDSYARGTIAPQDAAPVPAPVDPRVSTLAAAPAPENGTAAPDEPGRPNDPARPDDPGAPSAPGAPEQPVTPATPDHGPAPFPPPGTTLAPGLPEVPCLLFCDGAAAPAPVR
ncbi:lytic transglycosylase [Rhodococcus rhodnii]|uniref:Transglycosylase SLT domain-containing protein n=2 Tax=Rhodococcus rhodnii TaxID=38312 RepID=R7WLB7_9NOCA|nr:lytic murein transglycosylase [Rhodococcus rhodnii]EOM76098.1 hypothetical protein Rrhod_2464 [Rhodococcus rhodnii LMG 5362]TXG91764.1 lytic transglycosylase [Rhodococcus rhodnii]